MSSVSLCYASVTLTTGFSLQAIWSAINSLQIVIQLPMIKQLYFPGNTQDYLKYIVEVVNLDLLATQIDEENLYYLPEAEPFNINFEAVGIETKLLITNIGSVIWMTGVFFIFVIFCLILKKVRYIWEKFGKNIYFNGIIRYVQTNY